MASDERWLLPAGIEELLPPQARQVEALRRRLLDVYQRWGYALVMTPFVEYLESLLVGTGTDLSLQTFTVTDQLSGRLMGIRADMTPQVARIDAHKLGEGVNRLCYQGSVLHTRPDGFAGSRSPLQVGAELYGHAGVASDVEILSLLIETLAQAGVRQYTLDIGHVGVFRTLVDSAGLTQPQSDALFDILQRKAHAELDEWLEHSQLSPAWQQLLVQLPKLLGGEPILAKAHELVAELSPAAAESIAQLQAIARRLVRRYPQVNLFFDLSELRGYHYHTGVVFAAYVPGQGQAVAHGGRYDEVGAAFGRARPATGFSSDLKTLIKLADATPEVERAILAPDLDDPTLWAAIGELRAQGETVIVALNEAEVDERCDRTLVHVDQRWQLQTR